MSSINNKIMQMFFKRFQTRSRDENFITSIDESNHLFNHLLLDLKNRRVKLKSRVKNLIRSTRKSTKKKNIKNLQNPRRKSEKRNITVNRMTMQKLLKEEIQNVIHHQSIKFPL